MRGFPGSVVAGLQRGLGSIPRLGATKNIKNKKTKKEKRIEYFKKEPQILIGKGKGDPWDGKAFRSVVVKREVPSIFPSLWLPSDLSVQISMCSG